MRTVLNPTINNNGVQSLSCNQLQQGGTPLGPNAIFNNQILQKQLNKSTNVPTIPQIPHINLASLNSSILNTTMPNSSTNTASGMMSYTNVTTPMITNTANKIKVQDQKITFVPQYNPDPLLLNHLLSKYQGLNGCNEITLEIKGYISTLSNQRTLSELNDNIQKHTKKQDSVITKGSLDNKDNKYIDTENISILNHCKKMNKSIKNKEKCSLDIEQEKPTSITYETLINECNYTRKNIFDVMEWILKEKSASSNDLAKDKRFKNIMKPKERGLKIFKCFAMNGIINQSKTNANYLNFQKSKIIENGKYSKLEEVKMESEIRNMYNEIVSNLNGDEQKCEKENINENISNKKNGINQENISVNDKKRKGEEPQSEPALKRRKLNQPSIAT